MELVILNFETCTDMLKIGLNFRYGEYTVLFISLLLGNAEAHNSVA